MTVDLTPPAVQAMTLGTMAQRRETRQEIDILEARLTGSLRGTMQSRIPGVEQVHDIDVAIPGFGATGDRELLEYNLEQDRRLQAKIEPPRLSEAEQRANEARIKELTALLQQGMLRDDELRSGSAGDVQQFLLTEGSKTWKQLAIERRNRMVMLDPKSDDPYLRSLERYRKKKLPMHDPQALRQNFELVDMTPATTAEQAALSDIAYLAFLRLKDEGREQVYIQQVLGWNAREYEVAMQRLRPKLREGMARPDTEEPEDAAPSQGETLRDLRDRMQAAGISVYRLGRQLNMKDKTLRNWFDGKKKLTDKELKTLYDGVQALIDQALSPQEVAS